MSLNCDWLVLCERVIQDKRTDVLTCVNIIDQIRVPSLPAMHAHFAFMSRFTWEGDRGSEDLHPEFRLLRWSAKDAAEEILRISGTFPPDSQRIRVFHNIPWLRLRRAERVWFRIDFRLSKAPWRHGHSVCFDVVEADISDEERTEIRRRMAAALVVSE